jgi:hypothetical protein
MAKVKSAHKPMMERKFFAAAHAVFVSCRRRWVFSSDQSIRIFLFCVTLLMLLQPINCRLSQGKTMLTDLEVRLLRPLVLEANKGGLAVQVKFLDLFAELERKGLVSLSAARTGLFRDPEMFWVRVSEGGRAAMSAQCA